MTDNYALNETEAAVAAALRRLPVAVTVTKRGAGHYVWQAYERAGTSETFAGAVEDALLYLFAEFHGKERDAAAVRLEGIPQ